MNSSSNPLSTFSFYKKMALAIGLLGTLALLLWHASVYSFLTDDAFISFRYAKNLSEGHGLVFNPGREPVEGYTNFLWVLILAAWNTIGFPPEMISNFLTIFLTCILWGLVLGMVLTFRPDINRSWLMIVPLLFLASTRSIAVWATSGLETRLFEVLVVAAVFRLIVEMISLLQDKLTRPDQTRPDQTRPDQTRPWPLSSLLLALSTLTRPDGLLISFSVLGIAFLTLIKNKKFSIPYFLSQTGIYLSIVGSHFVFRILYYQEWLPNTFYVKVGGRTWWDMGLKYLGAFFLEYAAYLWIPFLIFALIYHYKSQRIFIPLIYAAVIIPHMAYIASIGGDHFEYRPLDLYFPFFFLLIYDGAKWSSKTRLGTFATAAYFIVIWIGLVTLPFQSHIQFPDLYKPGFPGRRFTDMEEAYRFLSPDRDPIYRFPILKSIFQKYVQLLRATTERYVGIRQEEHKTFYSMVLEDGLKLKELVSSKQLPEDTYLAIACVGIIPYYSNLPTLDRLGLTDKKVARSEPFSYRILAHDKMAKYEYAVEQKVDFWSIEPVHIVWHLSNINFLEEIWMLRDKNMEGYLVDMGVDYYLLVQLPLGQEQTKKKFPHLHFQSALDSNTIKNLMHSAIQEFQARLNKNPKDAIAHGRLGRIYTELQEFSLAEKHFLQAIELNPGKRDIQFDLALMYLIKGELDKAKPLYQNILKNNPCDVASHVNLGNCYYNEFKLKEAREEWKKALELNPYQVEARSNLQKLSRELEGEDTTNLEQYIKF